MSLQAAIAVHRFGFAEPDLARIGADAQGWVLAQFQPGLAQPLAQMPGSAAMQRLSREALRASQPDAQARRVLREANLSVLTVRWRHQIDTPHPVRERWIRFWANHFTVAATKAAVAGLVWPFENEVIRPHASGRFVDLLRAATTHPAMLLYLDNAQSVGPTSRLGQRRERGLNENLARELLELHTLGVNGGYTQADVTALARLLTGWTVERRGDAGPGFAPERHEPGRKRVLGRDYPEGPGALDAVLADLARHPATARRIAFKLARHFVADTPPERLVAALERRYLDSGGDLAQVAHALFTHPDAWAAQPLGKARPPEDLWLSVHRLLSAPPSPAAAALASLGAMGQAVGRTPSPQGWSDLDDDWLAADAVLKRLDWAQQVGRSAGHRVDARDLAERAWGPTLSADTRQQIARAESPSQALALLVASPECQRRL